jgi:putative membrane protein
MPQFFHGDGKAALTRAVVDFERGTAAELVIAVRPRSGQDPQVGILVGIVCALISTAFLLYSEPEYDLYWFLVVPALVGLAFGAAANTAGPQWLFTSAAARERRVLQAARATFLEKAMADTRGRTGVLLFISLAERVAVVVADLGVRQAIPAAVWDPAVSAVTGAVARGATASELLAPISALAAVAGKYLPRAHDDVNELADEVCT